MRGQLYDSNFYSGFSAAFWTASFKKGDHISVRTTAAAGDTPPCQILYMPGTDDNNVGATTPILDPDTPSQTRDGSRDFQRWVTATETGTYVLAMTNADIFLTGPHQCLDAARGEALHLQGDGRPQREQHWGGKAGQAVATEGKEEQWRRIDARRRRAARASG